MSKKQKKRNSQKNRVAKQARRRTRVKGSDFKRRCEEREARRKADSPPSLMDLAMNNPFGSEAERVLRGDF